MNLVKEAICQRHFRVINHDNFDQTTSGRGSYACPVPSFVVVELASLDSGFTLVVAPDEGFWMGGKFRFHIYVGDDYNIAPPQVKCLTRLWHPNIGEEGDVCLSILRQSSIDGMGWAPTRRLKDVIWGLSSLFSDLLNFDDPLNIEAAEHYQRDKEGFRIKVKDWVSKYAKR